MKISFLVDERETAHPSASAEHQCLHRFPPPGSRIGSPRGISAGARVSHIAGASVRNVQNRDFPAAVVCHPYAAAYGLIIGMRGYYQARTPMHTANPHQLT